MTTIFKKVALASVLALSFAGVAAQAATTDIGEVTENYSQINTPGTVGSFSDLFNFTVAPNVDANVSALSFKLRSTGITLSEFSLYSYAQGSTFDTASASLVNQVLINRTTVGEYSPSLYFSTGLDSSLGYSLVVKGQSYAAASNYNTQIQISPVPEPETYAMLLAGLGVMGFVARRRQKSNKA